MGIRVEYEALLVSSSPPRRDDGDPLPGGVFSGGGRHCQKESFVFDQRMER